MKTERRHDLETNVLADTMARWIDHIKPYTNVIWAVVVVGLVIAIGGYLVTSRSSQREAEAWEEYYNAVSGGRVDLNQLQRIAQEYSGTKIADWANIARADALLRQVSFLLFVDGPASKELLGKTRRAYVSLQKNSTDPEILSRASFGLGRAFEMEGRLDKAQEQYALVTGVFGQSAAARMKAVENRETKEFYGWFVVAQPTGAANTTGPGTPGARPLFEPDSLGGDGGLFPPGFGLDLGDSGGDGAAVDRYVPSSVEPAAADEEGESDAATETSDVKPSSESADTSDSESADVEDGE